MPRQRNNFHLKHAGEIREALIALEGEDGSFELLRHGRLAGHGPSGGARYALVRSLNTGRVHTLVEDDGKHPWQPLRNGTVADLAS